MCPRLLSALALLALTACGGCLAAPEAPATLPGEVVGAYVAARPVLDPPPDQPLLREPNLRDDTSCGTAGPTSGSPALPDQAPGKDSERWVWGIAGLRGYAFGQQVAPNGVEFNTLFALGMDFNLWVWRSQGLYLFSDSQFWGQRATQGVTNPSQGAFDFSKRELDLSAGFAWNYYEFLEVRAFAYSLNNLNRGTSTTSPSGYADGVGLENRLYLADTYADLGTDAYDIARASFVSLGYYPTKDLVDARGNTFRPGPFAHAYLTYDLLGERCYLFADAQLTAARSCTPKLLDLDAGVAFRPFPSLRRLEFRVSSGNMADLRDREWETSLYGEVRILY